MTALLETLLTFVGVMLLLALVSQSLLEAVKTALPFQSITRKSSLKALLTEATRAAGVKGAGDAVYRAADQRLRGLGQDGWWNLRLDSVEAGALKDVILTLDGTAVDGVRDCPDPGKKLEIIAELAEKFFPLSMDPVATRYERRMRVASVGAAVVIVLGLNVDAISLMERSRTDPEFRAAVMSRVESVDSLLGRADSLRREINDSLAVAGVGTPLTTGGIEEIQADLAATQARLDEIAEQAVGLFDPGGTRDWRSLRWWAGMLLSVLLVSLGAPFWNDLLGSLFGVKNRIQADARRLRAAADYREGRTPPGAETST